MSDPRLANLPPRARAIVEEFFRVHEAEATTWVLDFDDWYVRVGWNQYGENGKPTEWATLKIDRITVVGDGENYWQWRCQTYDDPCGHTFSTCPKAGYPVVRSEHVAEFLERFRPEVSTPDPTNNTQ